jgi:DMSO reductase anchor subunit
LLWLPTVEQWLPEWLSAAIPDWAAPVALLVAIPTGLMGIYCSAMIYIATRRQLWRAVRTLPRFLGTTTITGIATVTTVLLLAGGPTSGVFALAFVGAMLLSIKIAWEWSIHLAPEGAGDAYDRRSRQLVKSSLQAAAKLRIGTGLAGAGLLVFAGAAAGISPAIASVFAVASTLLIIAGEGAERWLYFSSVVHDRMPGTL